jgi:hypothetical protein
MKKETGNIIDIVDFVMWFLLLWSITLNYIKILLPSATLATPIAMPPFPALPLPLVLPDAPSAVPPFIAIPPFPPFAAVLLMKSHDSRVIYHRNIYSFFLTFRT